MLPRGIPRSAADSPAFYVWGPWNRLSDSVGWPGGSLGPQCACTEQLSNCNRSIELSAAVLFLERQHRRGCQRSRQRRRCGQIHQPLRRRQTARQAPVSPAFERAPSARHSRVRRRRPSNKRPALSGGYEEDAFVDVRCHSPAMAQTFHWLTSASARHASRWSGTLSSVHGWYAACAWSSLGSDFSWQRTSRTRHGR